MTKPSRLFSLFAAAVVLPTAVLGLLGLRSFRTEQRLLEAEAAGRWAAAADALARRAEETLRAPSDGLAAAARSPAFQEASPSALAAQLPLLKTLAGFPVEAAFVLDVRGDLLAPAPAAAAAPPPAEPSWGPLEGEVKRLERMEFVDKDAAGALAGYRVLGRGVLSPVLEASRLKMVASAARKSGDAGAARSALEELAARFDLLPDPAGLPTGLLARQLLVKLHEAGGSPAAAERTRLEIREGLVLGRWPLEEAALRRLLEETAPAGGGPAEAWALLEKTKESLDALRVRADRWRTSEEVRLALGSGTRGAWRAGDRILLAEPLSDAAGVRRGTLMAVVPSAPLLASVEKAWGTEGGSLGVKARWLGDPAPAPGWRAAARRTVTALEPPLVMEVLAPVTAAQETLLRRRRRVYGGLVVFSLLVTGAGLVFMLRALRRETEAARLKSDFVAGVSHELRTPLASIAYIGERLAAGRTRSPEEAREFLGMLQEETARLQELVSGVLDFARMEDGRRAFRKEPLDLGEVAADAADRFEGKARAHGFAVDKDLPASPLPVTGDGPALVQAVMNLLDNALKYSGDSRRVTLSAGKGPGGSWVRVRDFGIGIPPGERGRIFDRFYRAGNVPDRAAGGGVGLGLALVKRIADGHGARISVDSASGRGSVFTLLFPS